jgi:PIN domain nuclease of toxin-antitoxin system
MERIVIVLDTSALIFWTLEPNRLSTPAAERIVEAKRKVISSISIWEIGLKVKQEKLKIPLPINEYVDKLKTVEGMEIVPVDERIWLKNLELDWDHKDPADRTIVATAILLSIPLVTSDRIIKQFYAETVW